MSNPELTRRPSPLDRKAHAIVRLTTPSSGRRRSAARKLATGLGWFSLALGLFELLAARRVAGATGLHGATPLLPLYGLREIASGIGLLAARSPQAASGWAWTRVAGDALDLTTLAAAAALPGRPALKPVAAMVAVAGVTALDIACARTLRSEAHAARQTTDYSDRSGFGDAPDALRGAAREDYEIPREMRAALPAPTAATPA